MRKPLRPARTLILACATMMALLAVTETASAALGQRFLRQGSRGADVRQLQTTLTRLGHRTPATGYFGPMTAASMRAFERRMRWPVNGVTTPYEGRTMVARAASRTTTTTPGTSVGGTAPQAAPTTPAATTDYVFPVRGAHNYGTAINRYGAGRGGRAHQGHDVFARAGTPLVAARRGRVSHAAYQGAAGNYLVIQADDGTDLVYMHMQSAPAVRRGQYVRTGQFVGRVGCTGSCSGDHLHFEVWTAHWFSGGRSFDPLPRLRTWDRMS